MTRRRPSTLAALALAAVALVALFVANARWESSANVDVVATDVPAWSLVDRSTLDLSDYSYPNPWFVEDRFGRIASDRAPGLIATALPAYAIMQPDEFSNTPGTMTALLLTLAAVGVVVWLSIPLVGTGAALVSGLIFALGTTTWAVSSSQLWPHGPGQFSAILAVAGFAASRYMGAGLATAWAVTMRPIAAVYATVMGILESWQKRDWRPALKYGLVSACGILLVLAYNRWLFGRWSLVGGPVHSLIGGFGESFTIRWYAQNLWTMFFSLRHGLFVLSPIVAVATIGTIVHRKAVPSWAWSAAIGGGGYLLIHAAFNRASGGAQVFYRYPLEALALAAVALAVGGAALYRSSPSGRLLVIWSAGISIAIQFINVFYLSCITANPNTIACQIL